MSNRMIAYVGMSVLLAASVSSLAASHRTFNRDALVGKWTASVTPDDSSRGSAKEFTDTLEIKGGKFTSDTLAKTGYESATYEDRSGPIGVAAQFSVTLTNKNGDTAKWTGTSSGKEMTGELTVTKKNGDAVSYTFKATRP